jgi:hypothetical protein
MLIFGLSTLKNLRKNRRFIQPMTNIQNPLKINGIKRRDHQLLAMLLLQVMVIIIFTLPFAIQKLIDTFTLQTQRTPLQTAQYNLLTAIVRLLSYGSHAFGFFFYTLSAKIFRTELLKIINTIYRFFTGKNLLTPIRSEAFGMTFMRNDGNMTQMENFQQERRDDNRANM